MPEEVQNEKEEDGKENKRIEVVAMLQRIFYPKDHAPQAGEWALFAARIKSVSMGEPVYGSYGKSITFSGNVATLEYGREYNIIAKPSTKEKYKDTYELIRMSGQFNMKSQTDQRTFLEAVLTPTQVNNLYESIENPFEVIKAHDASSLLKIKGFGESSVQKIFEKYDQNIGGAEAYVKLDGYGLTKNMIDKLVGEYGGAEMAVKAVLDDPYSLINEVDGVGWKRADEIAMASGMDKQSPKRIKAYITNQLTETAECGDSWVDAQDFLRSVIAELDICNPDKLREALHELHDSGILWWDDSKSKFALTRYQKAEKNIAEDLARLMAIKPVLEATFNDMVIKELEQKQGWEFTDEQIKAIKMCIDNPVCVITGLGGTGKTSVVAAVLKILGTNNFAQTALSGRAASRMSEITGIDGYTIHRLLGYNPSCREKFAYNRDHPLAQAVVILDEVSMVGSELFDRLVQAIMPGSRFIMLGDDGQLESIGAGNVFKDVLSCGVIPVARLTKIHRQAAKSAIITDSIKVRHGQQLFDSGWTGNQIRGELNDLELDVYPMREHSHSEIIKRYTQLWESGIKPEDIQVVVPTRIRGAISALSISTEIQSIVNPDGVDAKTIHLDKNTSYKISVGDQVILTKNHYRLHKHLPETELGKELEYGEDVAVFNGNRGKVKLISYDYMVVDFEQQGLVEIPSESWKTIELAYALTCHKLQGSEAPYVIVGLDFSARILLTREWLYTAITRAKKYCIVCGESGAVSYAIESTNIPYKQTFLQEYLKQETKKNKKF